MPTDKAKKMKAKKPKVKKEKKEKKVKKTETKVVEKPVSEPEPVPEVVESVPEVVESVDETPKRRKRRVANKESILNDLDALILSINQDIDSSKLSMPKSNKTVSMRTLKSYVKRLTQVRNDANKTIKERKKPTNPGNQTSGFMKEVPISKELAKFTGWDPKSPASRVQVTKFLCDYIKNHDLQQEGDRRRIEPDSQLSLILGKDTTGEPLTYYSMQRRIQHHFG